MSQTITTDELIAEISRLSKQQCQTDEGITGPEICEALSVGEHAGRRLIRAAIKAGILTPARRPRANVFGEIRRVPVYLPAKSNPQKSRRAKSR